MNFRSSWLQKKPSKDILINLETYKISLIKAKILLIFFNLIRYRGTLFIYLRTMDRLF